MLHILVPSGEYFHEGLQEFVQIPETKLTLEHSLLSLSKWESKWKVPFLDRKPKTLGQMLDYYRCMTIGQEVSPLVYACITPELHKKIEAYMNDPMTATTVSNRNGKRHRAETLTSELIYCYMFMQGIPIECEKWHLNRLLMLLQVCALKNSQGDTGHRMSMKDIRSQNKSLNAMRRAKLGSKG